MENFKQISIQKNRGWRGLAKAVVYNEEDKEYTSMVFSFSQAVWEDMLHGYMVIPHKEYYYILVFDNTARLPAPTQQRSVLIKNFKANILDVNRIKKDSWTHTSGIVYSLIYHYLKNNNHHTQSDWNYIGIRVIPEI